MPAMKSPSFRQLPVVDSVYNEPYSAVVDHVIDIADVMARVAGPGVGAISLFIGTVREHNDGRAVTGIDYEAYQPMAERELRAVAQETCAATPGLRVAVVHRVGTLTVGEASVVIVAAHVSCATARNSRSAIGW
jgi:molybdopterin synthase catalytic subunit